MVLKFYNVCSATKVIYMVLDESGLDLDRENHRSDWCPRGSSFTIIPGLKRPMMPKTETLDAWKAGVDGWMDGPSRPSIKEVMSLLRLVVGILLTYNMSSFLMKPRRKPIRKRAPNLYTPLLAFSSAGGGLGGGAGPPRSETNAEGSP